MRSRGSRPGPLAPDATGIERELLAYWINEGVLIAAQGEGLGKGKHRHFGFEAIHIAAVLKEQGRYGVQTAGLKQIASLLWRIVALGSDHPDIPETIALDASVLRKCAEFPQPYQLSQRAVGWLEADIDAWIATCIAGGANDR